MCAAPVTPFSSAASCAAPMNRRSLPDVGAEVALPVDVRERVRDLARELRLAAEEHALPRHEHVVEDRERLHQVVVARDGRLELVGVLAGEAAADELDARRVDRHRERHGVVGVDRAHGALRDDHELVRDHRAGRVRLGAAHDDAVGATLDDAQVEVGVVLVGGPLAAIALDVGDGGGGHQLLALEALHEVDDTLVVGGAVRAIDAAA